jgi:flagellin
MTVINTNSPAQMASARLAQSSTTLARSLARLSSGSKITSPADDSAGLAVAMKLSAQMARLDGAANNLGNAISFGQTQDGYLQKTTEALTRMSELAVAALDVTKTDVDVAQESTNYAKYSILVQAGTAMLAQANLQPQTVLKLLG